MNRKVIFYVTAASVLALAGALLFLNPTMPKVAADNEVWISIDEHELETVRRELGDQASKFDIEVTTVNGGIAIARLNSAGLESISVQIHKSFNKCGGYVVHDSQQDAFLDIETILSVDTNARLVDYTIDNQANVNQLIPEAAEANVKQMIMDLSAYPTRRHDQPTGLESAQFIKAQWDGLAAERDDMSVNYFGHTGAGANTTPQPSIVLTITGTTFPDEVVVLGGHQDSIRSGSSTGNAPGADDDASGIASLTEAIRVLAEKNFRPERTIQFMAYAAEEVGLRGSKDIAQIYSGNNTNVIGALQLDMTNYKGNSSVDIGLITDFTNAAQNQFVRDLIAEYLPTLTTADSQCNYGCSDHASWTANGFPSSFPFEATFGTHNSTIHSGNDTIAQSGNNANHAVKFSKLALAYAGELAKGSISAPPSNTRFDFDGDSKTDVSIFRPSLGEWWYLKSTDGNDAATQFGAASDKLVPADFTGDGRTDVAFFRETTGEWFVLRSEDQSFFSFPFGQSGDIPTPGDFDGDGKADPTVFRPATAEWFTIRSSDNQTTILTFGANGDKPTIEDFDGDGKDDIAIYRPSASEWWQLRSTDGVFAIQFGAAGDQSVPADFTNDGKADIAFFRPSTSEWFVLRSEDNSFFAFPFGQSGDIPTPGDFDGDGQADAAVYRPGDNTWYKSQSTSGFEATLFGINADVPLPAVYVAE